VKAAQIAGAALLSVNLIPEPCGAYCAVPSAFIHEAFTGLAALIAAHISCILANIGLPADVCGENVAYLMSSGVYHLHCLFQTFPAPCTRFSMMF